MNISGSVNYSLFSTSHPVLLLSPFFFPEFISTGRYNTVLAEALVRRGETVLVFASHPLYPKWKPEVSSETLPGISVVRGGAWLRYPKSAKLRRLVLEIWYAMFACGHFFRLKVKPRLVVPIFPPSLFFLILSLMVGRNSVIVGIVHDLQGVYAKRSASMLGRLLQSCIHWVESRCFARCHRLVFLSQSMAERAIQEYGLDGARCVVCYPFAALPPEHVATGIALANVLPERLTHVVYSGALGDKQNPNALFAFMNALGQRSPSLRCHVFSGGPHFERLKAGAGALRGCAVTFHDLVPAEQIEELYTRSSIQIIPQADGTGVGSLPSKLPNLLAAGVPLFAICEPNSELRYLVEKANAGVVAQSWEPIELSEQFDALLATLASETRDQRKARQRAFVQTSFSVDAVVDTVLRA